MKETTLCYIENNGRYLMLHRIKKEDDVNKGKWIGVGGKLENGESPVECIQREIKEETGFQFRYPLLVFVLSVGFFCAAFCPTFYALGVE